jgi:hypothetical protein
MSTMKKDLESARSKKAANLAAGRYSYEGFTSDEHAALSRHTMFGDDDIAFPSQEEWSRIVD